MDYGSSRGSKIEKGDTVILKRLLCILLVGIFIGCMMPSAAFAVDQVPIEIAEQAGAIIYDLYGAANNTSLAYDTVQPGPALTEIITLFQNSQAATGGEPISMAAIGTALLAAGAIAVVYDASNAVYNLVVDLDYENFGEFYQDFNQGWDDILSDAAGFVRDSVTNLFNWNSVNGIIEPVIISTTLGAGSVPYYSYDTPANRFPSSAPIVDSDMYQYKAYTSNSGIDIYSFCTDSNIYFAANLSSGNPNVYCLQMRLSDNLIGSNSVVLSNSYSYNNHTVKYGIKSIVGNPSYYNVDYYQNYEDGLNRIIEIGEGLTEGNIKLRPNPLFIGDPLRNPLEITIPNPSSPMPIGQPIHIGTDIEINPGSLPENVPANPTPGVAYPITDPDTLTEIIPGIWEDIVIGDVTVDPDIDIDVDPQPEPNPDDPNPDLNLNPEDVVIPYIPIKLPSFRFNFRSIWHYVRDWVASLAQFFKLISLVWSRLPYPIVLPIYATLVIVIVIGVWRRFVS